MSLVKPAAMLIVTPLLLMLPATATPRPDFAKLLPPGAEVVATTEADLNGDTLPDVIVGYKVPREGLPPTEGRAAVLERTVKHGFRRYDLEGAWGGHYVPKFSVQDLTGDGRPELVMISGGGAAWQMLSVFRRAPKGGYPALLHQPGGTHLIWDANSDGLPEVLSNSKTDFPDHRRTRSFRWLGDRFIAWHTAPWLHQHERRRGETNTPMPNVVGLAAGEADSRTDRHLGMLVPVDSPAPAGQVVAQLPPPGTTAEGNAHLAVSAGSTQLTAGALPAVWDVIYMPEQLHDVAGVPAGVTPSQQTRWAAWLQPLLKSARQVVHLDHMPGPGYIFHLHDPWTVSAGGRWLSVRTMGVSLDPQYSGLLFLAEKEGPHSPLWPDFTTAIYTDVPVVPPARPSAQPLNRYLRAHKELEAFVTLAPQSWAEAVSLRGIQATAWPAPATQPPLQGDQQPAGLRTPVPDHAIVTVLNGRVRTASRQGDHIFIELDSAPGSAQRWLLPLKGIPMGMTPYVSIFGPDVLKMALHTRIPINQWH